MDDGDVLRHRVIATLLAVVFSATPFAFVLCGLNCAHAAEAAMDGHACHKTESTAPDTGSSIRGVPPRCTHLDAEEDSATRVESMFTMALPLGIIPQQIESLTPIARSLATIADVLGGVVSKPAGLQLRV